MFGDKLIFYWVVLLGGLSIGEMVIEGFLESDDVFVIIEVM